MTVPFEKIILEKEHKFFLNLLDTNTAGSFYLQHLVVEKYWDLQKPVRISKKKSGISIPDKF